MASEQMNQCERKIAEKREEINAVEDVIDELCDCPGADCEGTIRHLAMQRILAMLEAQLADLMKGFKEVKL